MNNVVNRNCVRLFCCVRCILTGNTAKCFVIFFVKQHKDNCCKLFLFMKTCMSFYILRNVIRVAQFKEIREQLTKPSYIDM